MDQVGAMYKISEILGKAFKEVNDVCAHYLADQAVGSSVKQSKYVEKKQLNDKPSEKPAVKTESQPKKEHKVETNQQKPKPAQEAPSPRPVQQSKAKPAPKQQAPSKNEKKPAAHPDKPKQPLSAFFLFLQEQKENLQKLNQQASLTDLTKLAGEIWRGLDESEKAHFIQTAEQLKVHYNKKLQKFYEKHPQEKTKKQLKKEKKEKKETKQAVESSESQSSSEEQKPAVKKPVNKKVIVESQSSSEEQKPAVKKPVNKKVIVVEEEENSESSV